MFSIQALSAPIPSSSRPNAAPFFLLVLIAVMTTLALVPTVCCAVAVKDAFDPHAPAMFFPVWPLVLGAVSGVCASTTGFVSLTSCLRGIPLTRGAIAATFLLLAPFAMFGLAIGTTLLTK